MHPPSNYRGRFAPTPTGPLHFGSLVAALASFIDARKNNGKWLVRIEDIDPLRELPGASSHILHTLEAHHLLWDEPVRYQSQQNNAYEAFIEQLKNDGHTYLCPCSRKTLIENNGSHGSDCRPISPKASQEIAIRFHAKSKHYLWQDLFLGQQSYLATEGTDDFVIKRKEGFYAYQMAVVYDDIDQNINHIIRGSDLLDSTPPQLALYQATNTTAPQFGHIPVIVNASGQKLSKQNQAPAISNQTASLNLQEALFALNHPLPQELHGAPPNDIINWACLNWDRHKTPQTLAITNTSIKRE
jgi:glutamyl-Q tRNA(Asp) synthetase